MKDIINAVLLVVSMYAGTLVLKSIYDQVQKAALEKAVQGLPSLSEMTRQLQKK